MDAEATTRAISLVDYRAELIEMDGLFFEGTDVVTGATKG